MTWSIGPGWTTTFNPFGSVSFNGSSQYLTTPANAVLAPVTNFTVEAWIYANTLTSTNSSGVGIVFIGNSTSNNGRLQFLVGTDGTLTLYLRNNSAVDVTTVTSSAGSILIDTWYHVAGVRNGNNYTLYVNGNPVGTTTSATAMTYAANILNIGFMRSSNLLHYWNGYISNFRLTNGVAVYTGAFNVPRAPLQGIQPAGTTNIAAITGTQTSLLLNTPNNASFIADSSANNFTLTNNGGAVAAALTPFVNGGGAGWEFAGPENGSASFNGSSQYLTTPVNATAFNYAAGGMTWEAWVNPAGDYTTGDIIFTKRPSGPTTPSQIEYQGTLAVTTGYVSFQTSTTGGVVTNYSPNITLLPNTWTHLAFVIDTTPNVNIYINGVSVFSAALTPEPTVNSEPLVVGGLRGFDGYFGGYISNFRMVKGVAVYTSNFTPPIRQLPATQQANVYGLPSAAVTGTQTSLLLNTPNNSQNTLDTSTNNFAITNTGAVPPSGISPFVPDLGSVSFNGTNQSLSIATNTAFEFGSGALPVECWIYPISFNATDGGFMAVGPQDGSATWILRGNNNGTLTFTFWSAATTVGLIVTSGAGIVNLNVWNHIAVTRSGSTFTIWADGVSVATGTSASAISNTGRPGRIAYGFASSAIRYQNCYISNVRWVKGVAVYTGAFTPSTQPLPATQSANVYGNPSAAITGTQTSLLLNTPNNAQFIADSSTNDFTVTNNNAALATSLTPFSS